MSASIFISFAAQDRKVASTICQALESRGFGCWISSRDILPGENFQSAIVRAIRKAKMMLLVFTANSNNSEEMTKELALASQQKLIVVPLRVEDVTPNDAFAYEFATRQWIDFFSDWEAAIDQLCERIANAIPAEALVSGAPRTAPLRADMARVTTAEASVPPPALEPVAAPPPAAPPPVAQALAAAPLVAAPEPAIAKVEVKTAAPEPAPQRAPEPPVAKQPAAPVVPVDRKAPEPVAAAPSANDSKARAAEAPAKAPPSKPEPKFVEAKAKPSAPSIVDPDAKPKSKVPLLAAAAVVVLLLVGLGFAVPALMGKKSEAKPAAAVAAVTPPPVTPAVAMTPASTPALTPSPATAEATAGATAPPAVGPDGTAIDPNAPPEVKAPPKPKKPRPVAIKPAARSDVPY